MRAAELYAEAERFLDAARMASEANAEKAMIGYLQKVPTDHPDYREAVLVLARALIRRGWSALAIDAIETALGDDDGRIVEHNLELRYALARAHEEEGELTVASDILKQIMSCQFDYREADSWQRRLAIQIAQIEEQAEPDASFDGERYVLGALVGKGGMGAVYRAKDCLLERDVAYKVLPKEMANDRAALEQLLSEARAAAALNHPNIVTIHDRKPRQTPSRITRATDRARACWATGLPRSPGDAVSVQGAGRALRVGARGDCLGSVRRSRDRVSKLSSKSLYLSIRKSLTPEPVPVIRKDDAQPRVAKSLRHRVGWQARPMLEGRSVRRTGASEAIELDVELMNELLERGRCGLPCRARARGQGAQKANYSFQGPHDDQE